MMLFSTIFDMFLLRVPGDLIAKPCPIFQRRPVIFRRMGKPIIKLPYGRMISQIISNLLVGMLQRSNPQLTFLFEFSV